MDSIPRLPMLYFDMKAAEPHTVDFATVLRRVSPADVMLPLFSPATPAYLC